QPHFNTGTIWRSSRPAVEARSTLPRARRAVSDDASRMKTSTVDHNTIRKERRPMAEVRSWAGLDVHARSVLAVTMDAASGEIRARRLPGETAKVVEFLAGLPGPTRVAY